MAQEWQGLTVLEQTQNSWVVCACLLKQTEILPMKNATFFLRQAQYDWLAAQLPEPVVKTKPPIPNGELLNGVLYILKTGCRWQDIPASVCVHDPSSCWRRFSFWRSRGALVIIWREVLGLLDGTVKT